MVEMSRLHLLVRGFAALSLALGAFGLGTIAEIFDGDAPHFPRGCVSQAWAVAEIARVWIEEDL